MFFQNNFVLKFSKGDGGVGTFDVRGGALPSFLVQIFQFVAATVFLGFLAFVCYA